MTLTTLVIWLTIASLGGLATILGSLMTLGTLLLWVVPDTRMKLKDATSLVWLNRLKLLGGSLALAIVGFALLAMISR